MRYLPAPSRLAAAVEALAQSHIWSREELDDYRARRVRAIVGHAARHVPYYRKLFAEAGVSPDEIRGPEDLSKIPVTTRTDLQRQHPADLVAAGLDPERLVLHSTSGTSGEPLKIRRTLFEEYLLRAFRLKEQLRLGMRPTDRRCSFRVTPPKPAGLERAPGHGELARVIGSRLRTPPELYSCDEATLRFLREAEPEVLVGSASRLSWIAGMVQPGDPVRKRLRYVETAGESCTPEMRRQITESFGVPLIDIYACHEFNLVASECADQGVYHVADWNLILEVVSGDRSVQPGEQGEVVATGLHSFAMPFIRYRINDLVIRGRDRCTCGAPCSTLTAVVGRTIEEFLMPDGRRVHPYILLRPLVTSAPWLRRYQIVQERTDYIRIKVVAAEEPGAEALALVSHRVGEALGWQAAVEVVVVGEIPAGANGKYRPYYSLAGPAGRTEPLAAKAGS